MIISHEEECKNCICHSMLIIKNIITRTIICLDLSLRYRDRSTQAFDGCLKKSLKHVSDFSLKAFSGSVCFLLLQMKLPSLCLNCDCK